jgi:hypothetical protein
MIGKVTEGTNPMLKSYGFPQKCHSPTLTIKEEEKKNEQKDYEKQRKNINFYVWFCQALITRDALGIFPCL